MAFKKTKGKKAAREYISRNQATKLLQIDLPAFRRLCIFKGIYPRVPKSLSKAQGGNSTPRTLYLRKDIVYLSHEPLIWKMREEKIHRRKIKTLMGKNEKRDAKYMKLHKRPTYQLDHMVLERYPTFLKALQDLDDSLSTCFLYPMLPHKPGVRTELVETARKLTVEFMNYVIEARALRKTFVAITGYYYRVHIQGVKITWMVPHKFPTFVPNDVDIRIMGTFVEFYCTLLGFVNYKLYQSLNLYYPPKLAFSLKGIKNARKLEEEELSVVESLSTPLKRTVDDTGDLKDNSKYDLRLIDSFRSGKNMELAKIEWARGKKQVVLFEKLKFFLGIELNRESLTFVIRSGGGLVSWLDSAGPGATYDEDDETITYQIVDRPNIVKKHLSRYYIQPQWVYDSFNMGMLLPVQDYFVGAELPSHLSPFEESHGLYIPPEMHRLQALANQVEVVGDKTIKEMDKELDSDGEEELEKLKNIPQYNVKKQKKEIVATEEDSILSVMSVSDGKQQTQYPELRPEQVNKENFHLATTFIHRKQKRLFKKLFERESMARRKGAELKKKRILYEMQMSKRRKIQKTHIMNRENEKALAK